MKSTAEKLAYAKTYRENNKEAIKLKLKAWYNKNKEDIKAKKKAAYGNLSKEEKTIILKKQYQIRKDRGYTVTEEYKLKEKEYRNKNRDKRKVRRNERQKRKYKENIAYRLEVLLRTRFYKAVKRYKVKSALYLVGCSSEELKDYISSKWRPEMNWLNFGEIWEIDHIVPINSFDLTSPIEQEKCFHYTNLQPLFKTTEIARSFGYNEIGNMNKRAKTYS